jgi:nitroreductase
MPDNRFQPEPVLSVIQKRVSVRKFSERPVSRKDILTCLEAARLAPSAENGQPWRFIILDDPETRQSFGESVFSGIYRHTRWALKAPVILVLCADMRKMTHRIGSVLQKTPFHYLDIGIAGEHIVLQAEELGLGTCWIGWFDVKKARKFFKLPFGIKICQLIAMGYTEKKVISRPRKRRKLKEIVFYNQWNRSTDQKEKGRQKTG